MILVVVIDSDLQHLVHIIDIPEILPISWVVELWPILIEGELSFENISILLTRRNNNSNLDPKSSSLLEFCKDIFKKMQPFNIQCEKIKKIIWQKIWRYYKCEKITSAIDCPAPQL